MNRSYVAAASLLVACASAKLPAETTPPPPLTKTAIAQAAPEPPAAADPLPSVTDDGIERISLGDGRERLIVTGYFHPDDAAIEPRFTELLATLARIVRSARIDVVEVHGYADDEGTTHYNLAIADRRAQTVERYLGTIDERLKGHVITHGDSAPEVKNATSEEGHASNRRVVARVDLTWPTTARAR